MTAPSSSPHGMRRAGRAAPDTVLSFGLRGRTRKGRRLRPSKSSQPRFQRSVPLSPFSLFLPCPRPQPPPCQFPALPSFTAGPCPAPPPPLRSWPSGCQDFGGRLSPLFLLSNGECTHVDAPLVPDPSVFLPRPLSCWFAVPTIPPCHVVFGVTSARALGREAPSPGPTLKSLTLGAQARPAEVPKFIGECNGP